MPTALIRIPVCLVDDPVTTVNHLGNCTPRRIHRVCVDPQRVEKLLDVSGVVETGPVQVLADRRFDYLIDGLTTELRNIAESELLSVKFPCAGQRDGFESIRLGRG